MHTRAIMLPLIALLLSVVLFIGACTLVAASFPA
jgi:predicted RND superfamily exporter protein